MARAKIALNHAAFPDIFAQWADKDGAGRADRIAAAQRSGAPVDSGDYRESVKVVREQHGDRPVFRVGPTVPYGLRVEATHGTVAKSLDAGGGD